MYMYVYIYIIRINYVCLSLRLFVSSSFIQHVHKMLHNTLQTLRHQALWHSNNVGNLRNSCIPSGIRHQHFAFKARLHDRPKFQVIHRASKKHQKSKHLRASSSIKEFQMEFQEYHSATSLGLPGCRIGGRSGCLASGARPRFKKRPPHKATSYSTSYSASTNSGLKEKREVDGRENCLDWFGTFGSWIVRFSGLNAAKLVARFLRVGGTPIPTTSRRALLALECVTCDSSLWLHYIWLSSPNPSA